MLSVTSTLSDIAMIHDLPLIEKIRHALALISWGNAWLEAIDELRPHALIHNRKMYFVKEQ